MYPISSAVAALFAAEQAQVLRITGTDANSNAISITQSDVMQNGFSIDRYSSNGTRIELGTAISAQMSLRLNNRDGRFDGIAFEGTELFVEIGISDWGNWSENPAVVGEFYVGEQTVTPATQGEITYIPCGYYTVDEQKRQGSTISLVALDRMMRLESTPPTLMPWTDHSDNYIADHNGNVLFFNASLSLPCTVAQLVRQICKRCYITLVDNLNSLPNYNYAVSSTVDAVQTSTYRSIIQWCAQIMGACAFMDWDGKLRFKWYSSADYTCNTTNRFTGELNANDITVTGVKYTTVDNVTYLAGTDAYSLDISSNYLITGNPSTLLANLYNTVGSFTYRPFTATVTSAPYLYPTDIITYVDNGGTSHNCILTNVNTTANGHTALAGQGETETVNNYAPPSSLTVAQAAELKKVANQATQQINAVSTQTNQAIQNLDNSLTQQEIFDRLTADGTALGMKLEEPIQSLGADVVKQLFFDGTYVDRGVIADKSGQNYWILDDSNNSGLFVTRKGIIGGFTLEDGSLEYSNDDGDSSYLSTNGIGYLKKYDFEYNELPLTVYRSISLTDHNIVFCNDDTLADTTAEIYFAPGYGESDGTAIVRSSYLTFNLTNRDATSKDLLNIFLPYGESYGEVNIADDGWVGRNLHVENNLTVYGTKSRIVETDQYSDRLLYCYETPSPLFGDVGEGVIADDGKCYVWLDPVFADTISTDQYQVFLQKYGDGDCWVAERHPGYFVVAGTAGLAFGWELKAKQKDFDQKRLDLADKQFTPATFNYGAYAAQHIEDLQKARESA